jgi:sarcosine oxidase
MKNHFDHVVVGGGPMGASAAKYLALSGARVLLISAPEPAADRAGLRSSHNDLSRLTRGLDGSPVWAKLAQHSIARYKELERSSGIPFFTESGCLTLLESAAPDAADTAANLMAVGAAEGVRCDTLDAPALRERFSALDVATGARGFHERADAGWLNPLDYVRAQIEVGRESGLTVWPDVMISAERGARGLSVRTAGGLECTADNALFAQGVYSLFAEPLFRQQELSVFARTVVRVELDAAQVAALEGIPSMIVRGASDEDNCYLVPPVQYPDGKHYIKIGGGRRVHSLASRSQLHEWYAGDGDPEIAARLLRRLEGLMPVTMPKNGISQACSIAVAPSGLPIIEKIHDNIGVLTGGNGHAAKCGDEVGRLGSEMMLGNARWSDGYPLNAFSG